MVTIPAGIAELLRGEGLSDQWVNVVAYNLPRSSNWPDILFRRYADESSTPKQIYVAFHALYELVHDGETNMARRAAADRAARSQRAPPSWNAADVSVSVEEPADVSASVEEPADVFYGRYTHADLVSIGRLR